jgi:hypothetical protein
MLFILFCLIVRSLSQQTTGRINTTFVSISPTSSTKKIISTGNLNQGVVTSLNISSLTPTSSSTPLISHMSILTSSETPTIEPSQTPTQLSIITSTHSVSPTFSSILTDLNSQTSTVSNTVTSTGTISVTSTLTVTQSPVAGNLGNNLNTNNSPNLLNMTIPSIAGIVIGSICIVIITGFVAYYCKVKTKNNNSPVSSLMSQPVPYSMSIQQNPISLQLELQKPELQQQELQQQELQQTVSIPKKWTKNTDGVDTWYVSSEGESVWILPDNAILEAV